MAQKYGENELVIKSDSYQILVPPWIFFFFYVIFIAFSVCVTFGGKMQDLTYLNIFFSFIEKMMHQTQNSSYYPSVLTINS